MWQAGRATLSTRIDKAHELKVRVKLQGDKETCQSLTLISSLLTVMNGWMSRQTFVPILEYLFIDLQTLRLSEHQGPQRKVPD